MKNELRHEMIRASAGSGKTYALVTRYIRLLAMGVRPRHIIALTFTRKAAGEFLQQILLRLRSAGEASKTADQLSRDIQLPDKDSRFFRGLLKSLLGEIGQLQLGTIDSFFASILSAFPYELGLVRNHRIMDEFEETLARRRALELLLSAGDEKRENRILQLYKQLTWGSEGKFVYPVFEDKLGQYHGVYLEQPDRDLWGNPNRIFPERPWWYGEEVDRKKLLAELRHCLDGMELKPAMQKGFRKVVGDLEQWEPGQSGIDSALWRSLLAVREDLANGRAEVRYSRTSLEIIEPVSRILYQLLQHVVGQEILRSIGITQSVGQLMEDFDRLYNVSVRETGSLVFSDFPMLLVKALCSDEAALGSREVAYRLDARADHWLLDEFQDTSRIQWKVLSQFTDEILQDTSGERSFFYVGDIKQSIYGWRGGDARLFQEIYEHYNKGNHGIVASSRSQSWRSAPPVLDFVNGLFGELATAPMVESVRSRWASNWERHVPSVKTRGMTGFAGWGLLEDAEALNPACIDLIQQIKPFERGLSCAILVRTNPEVNEITQALRLAGIPASMEGVVQIARDNAVGTWILAFLYAIARPDEDFPRQYLPLAGIPMDGKEFNRLSGLIRKIITTEGYTEALRRLMSYLRQWIPFEPFIKLRCDQLLEAATRFESTGADSLESFIRYLETTTVREASLETHVQVMTVHKAKGLGFDIVIAANFGAKPVMGSNTGAMHVHRNSSGDIHWILGLPRKDIYQQDPVLLQANAEQEALETFEALCLLYVATTRAKRALYCIAPEPATNQTALTWHKLFEHGFGMSDAAREYGPIRWHAEWGDPEWYSSMEVPPGAPVDVLKLDTLRGALPERRPMLKRLDSPSKEGHGSTAFPAKLRSNAGRQFGTLVHDFLSTIEWIDYGDPPTVDSLISACPEVAVERFRELVESESGKDVFTRPPQEHVLWREKPYVLRKGDGMSQGIIDRAVVFLDKGGKPERVVIYDYKTDTLDPDRPKLEQLQERYGSQLQRYREAVSALTGLEESQITTRLIPV